MFLKLGFGIKNILSQCIQLRKRKLKTVYFLFQNWFNSDLLVYKFIGVKEAITSSLLL